jgi:hypothetical protein
LLKTIARQIPAINRLLIQRDDLLRERNDLATKRDDLLRQLDDLVIQRDDLVRRQVDLVEQRDVLLHEVTELRLPRNVASFFSEMLQKADNCGAFPGARKAICLGSAFSSIVEPSIGRLMQDGHFDGIPTMVTMRELRLLANLFTTVPIDGAVLEIGCYLGGSTAAIARGLDAADAPNSLYVLDSFAWSDPGFVAHLCKDIATLQARCLLSAAAVEATKCGDWHLAFHEIHRSRPYYGRLRVTKALIPYVCAGPFDLQRIVPAETALGAVFVDGFKSWEATHSAMKALVPFLRNGSLLIFQDFSWYDCYWLPVLATLLVDNIELFMKADNTAVFKVTDVTGLAGKIEAFGLKPNPDEYSFYRDTLSNYSKLMLHSGDDVGFFMHTAQSYVLAYILGRTEEAKDVLEFLTDTCTRLGASWLVECLNQASFQIHA